MTELIDPIKPWPIAIIPAVLGLFFLAVGWCKQPRNVHLSPTEPHIIWYFLGAMLLLIAFVSAVVLWEVRLL